MPQLNPSPWFTFLAFSWLTLLTIIIPKTMAHKFFNGPTMQSTKAPKTDPWNWPWT